jgi:hypothetical protein
MPATRDPPPEPRRNPKEVVILQQQENPFQPKFRQDIFTGEQTPEGPAIPPLMFLIAAPFIAIASVFMIPIFPIAATTAALLGFLTQSVLGFIYNWSSDELSRWVVMALVMLVALFCALPLESRVARRMRRYRQVRHWIRVAGLALMINEIGLSIVCAWLNIYQYGRPWGLWAGVTESKLLRVAILAVCVHAVFRLIDTRGRVLPLIQRLGAP